MIRSIVVLLALLPLVSGCCLFQSGEKILANGVEAVTDPMTEEYIKYVIQRQPLPDLEAMAGGDAEKLKELKARWEGPRLESVNKLKRLLDEARD